MYMGTISYLRTFRLGEYAIFDFSVSIVAIYFLAPYLSKLGRKFNLDIPRRSWLYFTLPISVLVHLLFLTITPMTRDTIDLNGHYIIKIVMIILIILGVAGIKKIKNGKK